MPKTIQSFRDVEIELRNIGRVLSSFSSSIDIASFITKAEFQHFIDGFTARFGGHSDEALLSLLRRDIELIPDLNVVKHNLMQILNRVRLNELLIRDSADRNQDFEWLINVIIANSGATITDSSLAIVDYGGIPRITIVNRESSADVEKINYSGHLLPGANNTYDLGTGGGSPKRVKKIWAVDIDISGTATGFPSGDTNNYKQGIASSSLSLSTSFQDVTGATVSLDQNGVWLIIVNGLIQRVTNDVDPQITLNYDGTEETDVASVSLSGTESVSASVAQIYVKTVTGQPKIAKITGKKASGTGSSSVISGHTRITAVFLKP